MADISKIKTLNGTIYDIKDTVARDTFSAFPRLNLLDNGYFVGGGSQLGYNVFPFNQRGQLTYNLEQGQYGIDRWKASGSNLTETITEDCVIFGRTTTAYNRWFKQDLSTTLPQGTYTLSILVSAITGYAIFGISHNDQFISSARIETPGLHSITIEINQDMNANGCIISFPGSQNEPPSISVIAIKLEKGDIQTLAHQKNDEWIINNLPDWNTELQKCQSYLQWIPSPYSGNFAPVGSGICWTTTVVRIALPLSTPMINTPTVTLQNSNARIYLSDGSAAITPTSFLIRDSSFSNANMRNILCLECTIEGGISRAHAVLMISGTRNPGGILLSCEP